MYVDKGDIGSTRSPAREMINAYESFVGEWE
jgi:hypothetical protein